MDKLIEGYKRFRAFGWPERQKIYEQLAAEGQRPTTLVLACVDSRVDPAVIFDCGPGEIIVVRNVANLVPPYAPDQACHGTSAALEFGVNVLNVTDIIVLGHGMCGGVMALLNGAPDNAQDFVAPWMAIAQPAKEKTLAQAASADHQKCCEHEVIKISLANLMTFPWVAERVNNGSLRLHGGWYAIKSGTLAILNDNGTFEDVA